jgi:aminoglycoside 2''-phosphotransferase
MIETFPKPSPQDVSDAVSRCFPALAGAEVAYLSEGYDSWVYTVGGDVLLRFPKRRDVVETQAMERRLLPELAPTLPLPVPAMDYCCDDGPGGLPFTGYRRVPGIPLSELPLGPTPQLGAPFGRFLKALQTFPTERAAALSVPLLDGTAWRAEYDALYERVIRRAFPLLGFEAREATEERFEGFLGNAANFEFRPVLTHRDLGTPHLLVDPLTREPTGVIDFGDACLADPAFDFTDPLTGELGIVLGVEGIAAVVEAYGGIEESFAERARFYKYVSPFHEIFYGLNVGDGDHVEHELRKVAQQAKGSKPCR